MSNAGKRITKAVAYKRVEFQTKKAGENLKSLLDAAVQARRTVGTRSRNISQDEDSPEWQVIGVTSTEKEGLFFGMLMTYSPGKDPLFVVDDATAENVQLHKLKAPKTADGKRQELLESVMYFAAFKNHLVVMQSLALRTPQLETYLQWLLHDSGVLASDNTLQLLDTPTQAIRDRVQAAGGVRAIKLGGELLPPSSISIAPSAAGERTAVNRTKNVALDSLTSSDERGFLAALKQLFSPSEVGKIDFEGLTGSNIEMTLTLRYSHKTTDAGHKLMDTLGSAFRNTDDVQTEIKLISGDTIKGSELKVQGSVNLTSYDGQLSTSEVNEALRKWLLSKVISQEVTTD